ncbi:permease [Fictibacillus macauensis ZFHKF-1]|uniref:Probable membrane transporter protein n=1 Tax=Fictibacillus macauensis ZFHKF-1 TaxID=1196324 RepID=I8UAV3_9BACL|nr:sulfite exporter TauE/SafE family protein [Fictibacillus macauensis]EIT83933.1 permease [Fictibacillus macauensis ZFHKF-1]
MFLIVTMLIIGVMCGFVGVGGAGFIISVLLLFDVEIHTALATSLSAMVFTTLSGAVSHLREGNIKISVGAATGIFGALGALVGSHLTSYIPAGDLHYLTAGMLLASAVLIVCRLFVFQKRSDDERKPLLEKKNLVLRALLLGCVTGVLSGLFGIGAAPFIQIGLILCFSLTIAEAIGTTMLVILPIAAGGSIGYVLQGYLDVTLLLQVLVGTMIGAYLGAKLTNYAPTQLLKIAMVATPVIAASLILWK